MNTKTINARRVFLENALKAGVYCSGMVSPLAHAFFFSNSPEKIKLGKSFYKLTGQVKVNNKLATMDTIVKADDKIETGENSKAVFVVGQDAILLRSNSSLKLASRKNKENPNDGFVVDTLRLITGAALTVFGKTKHQLITPTASMGIRGTGIYAEVDPDRTYLCTCYGIVDIKSNTDPNSVETVETRHHESPRYIYAKGAQGMLIQTAGVKNHTDQELIMLEALLGREPPFMNEDSGYVY